MTKIVWKETQETGVRSGVGKEGIFFVHNLLNWFDFSSCFLRVCITEFLLAFFLMLKLNFVIDLIHHLD